MQIKEGNADHPQNIRNKIVGFLFPVMIFFMLVLVLLGRSLRGKESVRERFFRLPCRCNIFVDILCMCVYTVYKKRDANVTGK